MKKIAFIFTIFFLLSHKCSNDEIDIIDKAIQEYLQENKAELLEQSRNHLENVNIYVHELNECSENDYQCFSIVATIARIYGRNNHMDSLHLYKKISFGNKKLNVFYNLLSAEKHYYKIEYPDDRIDYYYMNDDSPRWILYVCNNKKATYLSKHPGYYFTDENGQASETGYMHLMKPKHFNCK